MQKWKVPEDFGNEVSIGGANFGVVVDEVHGRVILIETVGDYSILASFGCELVIEEEVQPALSPAVTDFKPGSKAVRKTSKA